VLRHRLMRNLVAAFSSGAGLALLSALLFGASTPLAKLLLRDADAWMLAGLLYLGSGIGLIGVRTGVRVLGSGPPREASIRGRDWTWLALAILSGGIIGPVLLMVGLAHTAATSAALLLNLEGVLTTLLAWFVFRENFDRRIALGMAAIVGGGLVLTWGRHLALNAVLGPIMIAGACLAWAVDNNLTRKVAQTDPVQIALLKGCVAGAVNVGIAFGRGSDLPPLGVLGAAMVVGFAGYGVSLVLFVVALRHLGTARTGAYFSLAPFFGALIAVLVLEEPVTVQIVGASSLMALGVWLHLTERHEHEHGHEEMGHEHRHVHDEHHLHSHDGSEPPGEPHSHWHVHVRLRHSHAHFPDIHHRHEH
jgi:drug/metabolite transporter (DMT)-like permease